MVRALLFLPLIFLLACSKREEELFLSKDEVLKKYPILASDVMEFDKLFQLEKRIRLSTDRSPLVGDVITFDVMGDKILICDIFPTKLVYLFDSTGRFLKQIGRQGRGPGEYVSPRAVAFDAGGRIWVYDIAQLRVHAYSSTTEYYGSIDLGKFFDRIAIDGNFNLFFQTSGWYSYGVLDATIVKYDTLGNIQARFSPQSENFVPRGAASGGGLAIDTRGRIYAITPYEYQIRVFENDGRLIRTIGTPPSFYKAPKKPAKTLQMNDLAEFHRSWTRIENLLLYDDTLLFVITQTQPRKRVMDIYDIAGNSYKIGINCPMCFTPYSSVTKGSNLYMVEPSTENAEGDVQNPSILKFRLREKFTAS